MALLESLGALLAGRAGTVLVTSVVVAGAGVASAALPDQAADRAHQQVDAQAASADVDDEQGEAGPDANANETAHRVWQVKQNWEGERGCRFGQTVAAAARGEDPPDEFPCERAEERRANGQQRAEEARQRGHERAEEARERGQQRAEEARERGQQRAEKARERAQQRAEEARERGDDDDVADDIP